LVVAPDVVEVGAEPLEVAEAKDAVGRRVVTGDVDELSAQALETSFVSGAGLEQLDGGGGGKT
jgi:hypothetical protein